MIYESMLRKATVKAIDGVSRKAAKAELAAENAIAKLLARWNAMSENEKEEVAAIVVATATTAVTAIAALKTRRGKKAVVKKVARAIVKRR